MTLTIYWSPVHIDQPEPAPLLKELDKNKKSGPKSYYACPSVSKRLKNTFVFTLNEDFNPDKVKSIRPPTLSTAETVTYQNSFLFFSSSPVTVFFTAPFFHPPKHFNFGAVIPGSFDIGQWYRPYNCEFQLWGAESGFYLEAGEPLFYMEVLTDEDIVFKKYSLTPALIDYAKYCSESPKRDGSGLKLTTRYDIFNTDGIADLVLNEIKRNVVDRG